MRAPSSRISKAPTGRGTRWPYYWHRFYSHQPDLNYESPEVRAAVVKAMGFWLDMGVDGFRLDAVPYLYER
jgi:maltose alpha-D-glucosyltransferase/alpha-amylase